MIAAPALWRPPSIIEWFTEGKAQRSSSTGKMKRNTSTGKIRRKSASNEKCCCATGVPCSGCPSATPASWTLTTATSVTNCPACTTISAGVFWATTTGSINGTFTLVQDLGNPCIFTANTPATVEIYSDIGCTVLVSSTTIIWYLAIGASPFGLWAYAPGAVGSPEHFDARPTTSDCVSAITGIANSLTVCGNPTSSYPPGAATGRIVGTGGTVDLTPN